MAASFVSASSAGARPALAPGTATEVETVAREALAPRWRVLVHNDDVTPMDFVVRILVGVFALGGLQAGKVMLEAHFRGIALVAVYSLEEAEARVERAHGLARAARWPLTFTYEPA